MRVRIATIIAVMLLGVITGGCGSHAQIGTDPETFKTVDALYTAVSLREPKLVDQCAERLKALQAAGKLPEAAHTTLEGLMSEAKAGGWESSQERLARFMEAQRR